MKQYVMNTYVKFSMIKQVFLKKNFFLAKSTWWLISSVTFILTHLYI